MSENNLKKLFELIEDVEFCMLTTVDEQGDLRSRPMATQREYKDKDLYFFTKKDSGKVVEIDHEAEVNLSYASPAKHHYVSVSGRALVSQDRAKMEALWNPAYKAWFPEGLDDPQIALVTVTIEKAEFWDSPSSTVVHLVGLAKAALTGQPYKSPGDHGTVNPSDLH